MTLREIIETAQAAAQRGHGYIQVKVGRRRSPKNWDRVRVMPGVYGRCVGEMESPVPGYKGEFGSYLIDVLVDDVLKRHAARPEPGPEPKGGT